MASKMLGFFLFLERNGLERMSTWVLAVQQDPDASVLHLP